MRRKDRAILILGERAALDHRVELVAPPAARRGRRRGERTSDEVERGQSVGIKRARGEVDGARTIGRRASLSGTLVSSLDRPRQGREASGIAEGAGLSPQAAALARATGQSLGDSGPVARATELLDLLAKKRVLLRDSTWDVRRGSVRWRPRRFTAPKHVASMPQRASRSFNTVVVAKNFS